MQETTLYRVWYYLPFHLPTRSLEMYPLQVGGLLYTHTQICKITNVHGTESTLHATWVLMIRIAIMTAMNIIQWMMKNCLRSLQELKGIWPVSP